MLLSKNVHELQKKRMKFSYHCILVLELAAKMEKIKNNSFYFNSCACQYRVTDHISGFISHEFGTDPYSPATRVNTYIRSNQVFKAAL